MAHSPRRVTPHPSERADAPRGAVDRVAAPSPITPLRGLILTLLLFGSCQCEQERLATACVEEVCDGVDNDCDGDIDEGLPDIFCGTGACKQSAAACVDGRPLDCVAGAPSVETCNGVDDDCNGLIDDGIGVLRCGIGACAREVAACLDGAPTVCAPGLPTPETCDGQDEDCDGEIDEGLLGETCGVGACLRTANLCSASGQCEPGTPTTEVCNGIDDDCDGATDEGLCTPPVVACPGSRLAHVGDVVQVAGQILSAGGTTTVLWSVTSAPMESSATVTVIAGATAAFTPDAAGVYELRFCATDDAGLVACCTTRLEVSDCELPPAPPVSTACDASWDGRPIVTFPPVAAGLHHDLVDVAGSTLAVARAGDNWLRPATRIAPGDALPGEEVPLGVRACRDDDAACCSAPTMLTVNVIEACDTPIAPTPATVVFSEYVVDGEGSCSPPDCFMCQAGESIEITNLSNCPVSLDGTHFKYQNAAGSAGSVRWMNFGVADIIPPRGVYVAMRGRRFAPTCSASLPVESPGLYGLAISTLAMEGNNICSGWFNNTGGGASEMQLAVGTVMSQADLDFSMSNVLARIAPYRSSTGTCLGTGFDALDSCGSVMAGSVPSATLDPNQLGRLWHPCDAVVGAVPACVRD